MVPSSEKRSTKPFCVLLKAGVWMMPEGVTGWGVAKRLPVMKTASLVAAMAWATVSVLPVKATKIGLKFGSNLAINELVVVLERENAAPELAVSEPEEVLVPVT